MITIPKLRKILQKDDNLRKIRDNLYYFLSEFERKELNTYLKNNDFTYSKKYFINNFINRLKKLSIERQKEIIDLLLKTLSIKPDIPLQIGMVFDVDYNMPLDTTKSIKEKPIGYSKDAYFNDLIDHENYEELHNLYGIREIERDSNLLDGETK